MEARKSLILSVTSVKGGTGKTINVLNLAGSFSKLDKKVLIIDLDLFSGDIAAILKLDNDKDIYNLFEDLNNNKFYNLDDYIKRYNENISVLSAPIDPRFANKIDGRFINFLLSKVSNLYDVIIIDTNHYLNSINLTAFDKSNEIIYVLRNDLMNIKSMKTMISIYNNMGKNNFKILLYEAIGNNYLSKTDINNVLKYDVNYIISNSFYIKNINKYIMDGDIITLKYHYKENAIYDKIATSLLEVDYDK